MTSSIEALSGDYSSYIVLRLASLKICYLGRGPPCYLLYVVTDDLT